ncbi:hypothetical protein GGI25_004744 [Coemansia spiralis]|uniref:RlpA-like double-psi beta-barrel-protein domain-containing protein-containing protein n=2 Tax=Coemansia TaxID=4863 RepID=A0A9W8KX48_9FUNG|nr:hypothetical protein BX070DRAFT_227176 [Coemansia spiralis]KAJ1989718.1 hypothetical protein EDC05_004516 [Coemansia umbellata]KAJ2620525.1 hypothetical protein GGI26_004932 [Coemansia sp. RSA 1358]KAJ2673409.1 hypothetical protein GGI25_004744 [Coemansia spiralis]
MPTKPRISLHSIHSQRKSTRTESNIYRAIPLPPIPPSIEVRESQTAIAISTDSSSTPATNVFTQWSQQSATACPSTHTLDEEYAQETTLQARLSRALRKAASKNAFCILPLFAVSISCATIIMYLSLANSQACGKDCNELGDSGLYLSAFGNCSPVDSDNGTCGGYSEYFAKMNWRQFGNYSPMASSPLCAKCVLVSGPRGQVKAQITDVCMECGNGDIQLSHKAFSLIADANKTGCVPVSWGPC